MPHLQESPPGHSRSVERKKYLLKGKIGKCLLEETIENFYMLPTCDNVNGDKRKKRKRKLKRRTGRRRRRRSKIMEMIPLGATAA